MAILYGVVDTVTGLLLKYGYCDFTTNGSFNDVTQMQKKDLPIPAYCSSDPWNPDSQTITKWNLLTSQWTTQVRV